MNERTRTRRDFIQNITIALLAVSAVLLFIRTQARSSGTGGLLDFLSGADAPVTADTPVQTDSTLSAPVRTAVTGPYGRYANITFTTTDENFEPLRGLLEQALDSAQAYTVSDGQAFLGALGETSVYYDFLSPLPMSVLAELARTAGGDETVSARRLVIAEQDGGVFLYLWDSGSRCLRCETTLSPADLTETVEQYEPGSALFAFEHAEGREMDPCSLFPETEPALPVLSANIPLPDTDHLLVTLGFNPNTQNRYTGSGGTEEVITESGRTLRVRTDGTVLYTSSGGDGRLSISTADEIPTPAEAALETTALLNRLLSPAIGEAVLYLESIQQSDSATTLRFGYQAYGVPIRSSSGQSAAEVTLNGTAVSAMTLRIRQYASDGTVSLLLPLRQALAIAARHTGAELSIGYVDDGSGAVSAHWLAE